MCSNSDILHNVILSRWGRYRSGSNWTQLRAPADRWWVTMTRGGATSNSQVIHFNIVSGSFLTDGKPFDRLPLEYVSHPTYRALFDSEGIVGVRPSTMRGMIYEGHYQNHEIHLLLAEQELIIRCRQDDEIEEFIPSPALAKDLPCNLIDGLDPKPGHVTFQRRGRFSCSPKKPSLSGQCQRNLNQEHLSLLIFTLFSTNISLIHFDRWSLIQRGYLLECQSFPGFVLDYDFRGIDTLIGLKTMISLRSEDNMSLQRKVIVPKGSISSAIGLHGHPSVTLTLRDQGGYFAYDVDKIPGRLQGSRSIESDLFLIQLHAITSSPLPDDLTGRSGTNEALDYLSSSSSFSMYTLSDEARGYLDSIAALTPSRSTFLPYPRMTETIKWNHNLPILSQHPAFLLLVESILEYWRKFAVFYSLEDLLKPIKHPTGMNYLSVRARARDWVFHHVSYSCEDVDDSFYQPRDCMKDMESQEREKLAFQVASLCQPSNAAFPNFLSSTDELTRWRSINAAERWSWDDIPQWLPHASFLGYCEAPFEFLATLAALARRPHQVPPSPTLAYSLDLREGQEFDPEQIKRILANYTVAYEQSRESRIVQGPNEGQQAWDARVQQARRTYKESLAQQKNQVIAEMRNHWSSGSSHFGLSAKRLLILDGECIRKLSSTLRGWRLNKAFLNHMRTLPTILAVTHAQRVNWPLYDPISNIPSRAFNKTTPLTLKALLNAQPSPPRRIIPMGERSSRVLRPRPADIPGDLTRLIDHLNESSQSDLERRYVMNLNESVNAPRPPSDARTRLPSINVLNDLVEAAEDTHTRELNRLIDALTPSEYIFALQEAAGLFPALTPVAILRQISRNNRKGLPE
ncbi:12402_t:CDS:2, partial [Acaulospora colombiana]